MPFTFNYHRIIQVNDYIYQRKKEQSSWPIEYAVRSFYLNVSYMKKTKDMKLDLMSVLIDEMRFFFLALYVCVSSKVFFIRKPKTKKSIVIFAVFENVTLLKSNLLLIFTRNC